MGVSAWRFQPQATYRNNPTWANAGWLLLDTVTLVPGVPAIGAAHHGSKLLGQADDVLSIVGHSADEAHQGVNIARAGRGGVPFGFKDAATFRQFGDQLRTGLKEARVEDATVIFQGSSVTGVKYTTGEAFDVGRVSDFDIALASSSLLQRAKDLGIGLRSKGVRTGPLEASELESLGLLDLQRQLSQAAGREVNFMIFETIDAVLERGPSIILP